MAYPILADITASISELKRNPIVTVTSGCARQNSDSRQWKRVCGSDENFNGLLR